MELRPPAPRRWPHFIYSAVMLEIRRHPTGVPRNGSLRFSLVMARVKPAYPRQTRTPWAAFLLPRESNHINRENLINLLMLNSRRVARHVVTVLFFAVAVILPRAYGQADFTLTASAVSPSAVNAGGSSISTITVGTLNGFTGSVALSCTVAPLQTNGATCSILSSVTPPASATLTITTTTLTPPTLYTITVTGTGPSTTHTATVNLSVLAITPAYTVTDTTPTPSSLHAGSAATSTVTATPISGYAGTITFSCSTISPTVTPAPVCSFNPATVTVTNNTAASSTLTISTTGPAATRLRHSNIFYALWLPLPALTLIGAGLSATGRLRKKSLSWLLLGMIISVLIVTIGCGTSTSTSSSTTGTPKNTYTFTLSATDQNKLAPSNGTQSITLTVN
jgi:hypothetical protein